ncbi:MAG: adenylosuccinate synthetase, partial [Anaerolineaceae bacterium]|nr:adenylosuccinate synthetase [Anaerolineaceae bacterium]
LAEASYSSAVYRLGILRGYMTRHGAGPFVSEDPIITAEMQDQHNINNPWQRTFRVGHLDLLALRYALEVAGKLDGLAITNLDRLVEMSSWLICDHYHYPGSNPVVARHFTICEKNISAINLPADPTDLALHEERTHLLGEMVPGYTQFTKTAESYLEMICQALNTPLAITSLGPTALEKQTHFNSLKKNMLACSDPSSLRAYSGITPASLYPSTQ